MKTRLAHYMVPSVYIEFDCLPLHKISGKLDSGKLKALAAKQREEVMNPNLTDRHHRRGQNSRLDALKHIYKYMKMPDDADTETVENALLLAWEGELSLPFSSVTREDDFLSLGGHSLSAARLILVIENMFNVKLSVTDVLKGIKVKHQARDILRALDIKCGRQKPVYLKTGAAVLLRKVLDSAKALTIPSSYASLELKTSSKITPSLELQMQSNISDRCIRIFWRVSPIRAVDSWG